MDEDFIPLVPAGKYKLVYERYETFQFCRAPKVAVWFRIIDLGPHFGKTVPRYYNVRQIKGKVGKSGNFKAKRSGDLVNEFCTIANWRPSRLDRFSFERFKGKVIQGRVGVVDRDYQQKELHELARYSKVEALLCVLEDSQPTPLPTPMPIPTPT